MTDNPQWTPHIDSSTRIQAVKHLESCIVARDDGVFIVTPKFINHGDDTYDSDFKRAYNLCQEYCTYLNKIENEEEALVTLKQKEFKEEL
jgi:hypothetical protein